ncbi:hypothetical protein MG296_10490 [Flavobacteriaceae bacterium TK19130]|nr:hypothetical protein [Thermobacterium salinum]
MSEQQKQKLTKLDAAMQRKLRFLKPHLEQYQKMYETREHLLKKAE